MRIPKNIDTKLKEVCADNSEAYEALKDLIEYEGSHNSRQNIHCREVVENYISEVRKHEN